MSLLPIGFGSSGGAYTIGDSLRFRSSATAYLRRTPATAGNRKTWTWSVWVKRGSLGDLTFFSAYGGSVNDASLAVLKFNSSNQLTFDAASFAYLRTNRLFRDPSAWYHIVLAFNTTGATAANRVKMYINGVEETSFSHRTNPSLNADYGVNGNWAHSIGINTYLSQNPYDGYLTEVNFIDGQALTPTDFGEFDDNGTWKPIEYEGTYGTNGFYLDGTGVTDESGNGNDWTNNNLNLATSTATTYDLMKDTPSLVDADAGNFAVINPLVGPSADTISEANLKIATSLSYAAFSHTRATIGVSSGKWYWEVEWDAKSATSAESCIGITTAVLNPYSQCIGQGAANVSYGYRNDAQKFSGGSISSYGETYTVGDVIGVALDLDAGTLAFYKNGSAQGTAYSSISGTYFPGISDVDNNSSRNSTFIANFGQRPFAYTPPSGFLKLNTFNLPDSTIEKGSDYFNTVTYTGTGATHAITGTGFQPDWTWIKARSAAIANLVYDSVRGATEYLQTNSTSGEGTGADSLTAFNTDGFTLGADTSTTGVNQSGTTYVGWNWKANGAGVLNEVGDIDSTVSVNTTAGFSIVTHTGDGALATIGHGLGVAPSMFISKTRSNAYNWHVYHSGVGNTKALFLNTTDAAITSVNYFNNTSPTSTVFTLNSAINISANNYVTYCFAEIAGYSAFGSYTGNGSTDGPFIYTGFRPSWVLVKSTTGAVQHWWMFDNKREGYNVKNDQLYANLSSAEGTSTILDIVSTGFKMRTSSAVTNGNAVSYIYMVFAENPFKNSNAR